MYYALAAGILVASVGGLFRPAAPRKVIVPPAVVAPGQHYVPDLSTKKVRVKLADGRRVTILKKRRS